MVLPMFEMRRVCIGMESGAIAKGIIRLRNSIWCDCRMVDQTLISMEDFLGHCGISARYTLATCWASQAVRAGRAMTQKRQHVIHKSIGSGNVPECDSPVAHREQFRDFAISVSLRSSGCLLLVSLDASCLGHPVVSLFGSDTCWLWNLCFLCKC